MINISPTTFSPEAIPLWQTIACDNPVQIGQVLHGANGYWKVANLNSGCSILERCDRYGNSRGLFIFPKIHTLTSPTWKIHQQAPTGSVFAHWRLMLLVALGVVGIVGALLYGGAVMEGLGR